MSDIKYVSQFPVPLRHKKAFDACWRTLLINWLVPGAGYWLINEKKRATVLFCVTVIFGTLAFLELTYGAGTGARGGVFVPATSPFQWLPTMASLATAGVGPVYLLFAWCFSGVDSEPIRNLTQEYGSTYIMVTGLLNWLCMIDLFDRTTGRWIWRLPKDEQNVIVEYLKKDNN